MRYGLAQLGKIGFHRPTHTRNVTPHIRHITTERLQRTVVTCNSLCHRREQLVDGPEIGAIPAYQCVNPCTTSSVIFFASPNSIIVFGRKNSSLSTPA